MNPPLAATDTKSVMAAKEFRGFLRCGETENKKDGLNYCANRYFASTVSPAVFRSYLEALSFPNQYSEMFECSGKMKGLVRQFEEKSYDFFLCFDSNIVAPKFREGVAFFKFEGASPKITKIKL